MNNKQTPPHKQKDFVDDLIAEWLIPFPTLDVSAIPVVARIVRMSHHISQLVDANFARYNLTVGEFEVLAALTRHPQEQMTPKQLGKNILISSGGLTNRINRLEEKALIVRLPDPTDRRGVIIQVTPKGKALAMEAVVTHMIVENTLIDGLDPTEKEQLAALLKKLLLTQKKELN
jgi:Transcriptional regulators